MTQITTTPQQSAQLIACGVNPKSADMFYQPALTLSGRRKGEIYLLFRDPEMEFEENDTPAWSLSRLIDILPKQIKVNGRTYKLNIDYPPIEQVAIRYNLEEDELESLYGFMDDDLFSVVILMIEKLIANKHQLIESI